MHHLINSVIRNLNLKLVVSIVVYSLALMSLTSCGGSSNSASSVDGEYSLSGSVLVQRDSDIDLDLNLSTPLNNDQSDPQLITNPSTIGGYLSGQSGTYSNGEVFNLDDTDAFSVSLVEGQKIFFSAFAADSSLDTIDIDIQLKDSNDQLLVSQNLTDLTSTSLTVPSDDLYTLFLKASVSSSPILYTLMVSQSISQSTALSFDTQLLNSDFVPGEVLIHYKEQKTEVVKNTKLLPSHSEKLISNTVEQFQLEFVDTIPSIAHRYRFNQSSMKNAFSLSYQQEDNSVSILEQKIQTLELIHKLQQRDDVAFAEPNFILKANSSKNDPLLKNQWNLSLLATQAAWEAATGQGVTVAILDTGIDASHEEWGSNILSDSYDFISSSVASGDGDGFDSNPNDEGQSFHGSHVAGIIGATANNAKGIAGIAYDADIMVLRVLGVQDTGTSSDIAQAILYAAGLENTSGYKPVKRADIINLSFSNNTLSQVIQSAVDSAVDEGVILVAAAGNSSSDEAFYPAAFDNVIGVGAISSIKTLSSFSNFGINTQLVAPGGTGSSSVDFDGFQDGIISTVKADEYTEYQGTSMAAPHLSAVVALMKELKPDLDASMLKQAIENGELTDSPDTALNDPNLYFGAGILNAAKAVKWAANSTNVIPANLSTYPSEFGFIGNNTKANLYLTNQGKGSVTIVSIDEQENWLAITPKEVDNATGLGTYLIEVSPLSPLDQGEITINYQIDNGALQQQKLNVFISSSNQTDSTVGSLFVSLFKEQDILDDNYTPFISVGGQLDDGKYNFCFESIPSGKYLLSASTDNDKDLIAFDNGEAVGTYPLISRPSFIQVDDQDISGLNFDIQYPAFSSSEAISSTAKAMKMFHLNGASTLSSNDDRFHSQNTCSN